MKYKTQILVITHKEINYKLPQIYTRIQTGAVLAEYDYGYLRDDTGDNISNKNYLWADLTPQYWAWKNLDCDIIGINHYRRYFSKVPKIISLISNGHIFSVLKEKDIEKIFDKGYNCILPRKTSFGNETVREYMERGLPLDSNGDTIITNLLNVVKNISKEDYEIMKTFFDSNNKMYARSIFIMKKKDYNEYIKWIFNILENYEKTNPVNFERLYAYLAEALITPYIEKKKYRVKEMHIYNTEGKLQIWMIKYYFTKHLKKLKHYISNII